MPSQSPAALALQAVKNFRQKEIRAPTIRALTPYRAPIPKQPSSVLSASIETQPPKAHGQPNPFLPRFNTKTNRWAPAKYSLRQQAELIKKAKLSSTLHLLPPGPKLAASDIRQYVKDVQPSPPKLLNGQSWAQADAVVWEGEPKPKVAGADIGNRLYAGKKRMFKGHKRERTKAKRDIRKSILLSNMQKRIIRYKSVSLFCCFGLLASTDEPLASTIAEDGRTRSNLQRFPSQRNYPSNYNNLETGLSHIIFAIIVCILSNRISLCSVRLKYQ